MKHTPRCATPVRIVLTVGLLSEVWMHSHWSVAIMLSLLTVASEVTAARKARKVSR